MIELILFPAALTSLSRRSCDRSAAETVLGNSSSVAKQVGNKWVAGELPGRQCLLIRARSCRKEPGESLNCPSSGAGAQMKSFEPSF